MSYYFTAKQLQMQIKHKRPQEILDAESLYNHTELVNSFTERMDTKPGEEIGKLFNIPIIIPTDIDLEYAL